MPKALSSAKKKEFRSIAHALNPIVTVAGNGLSAGVFAELERALNDHELIKVKLVVGDRDGRKSIISQICDHTGAASVQEIGKVAVLFRANPKPELKTSNIR